MLLPPGDCQHPQFSLTVDTLCLTNTSAVAVTAIATTTINIIISTITTNIIIIIINYGNYLAICTMGRDAKFTVAFSFLYVQLQISQPGLY